MPVFILDTEGSVERHDGAQIHFHDDLGAFTQGYIEALFFTESSPGLSTEEWRAGCDLGTNDGALPGDVGFSALAPEALAMILWDCAAFQQSTAYCSMDNAPSAIGDKPLYFPDDTQAGRDFWYTRNGHGCGFWDGDWPEPYATALTTAAKAFGEVDAYLGDDGKVYLA